MEHDGLHFARHVEQRKHECDAHRGISSACSPRLQARQACPFPRAYGDARGEEELEPDGWEKHDRGENEGRKQYTGDHTLFKHEHLREPVRVRSVR